jgi:hypothetical protein
MLRMHHPVRTKAFPVCVFVTTTRDAAAKPRMIYASVASTLRRIQKYITNNEHHEIGCYCDGTIRPQTVRVHVRPIEASSNVDTAV